MEYDLNLLKQQQDELLNRLNSLSVEQPMMMHTDAYSDIENAASKLTENDRQELIKDQEYQRLVGYLNTYIQQEQFRLIRENLNKNKDAVKIMQDISSYINKFKIDNDNRKSKVIKRFEDYINNYSDMPYSEYIKICEK